ncbi:TerD family protein [Streptomyces sp. NPDC059373]
MTAELVRGQNAPLPQTRLEITVSADGPLLAGSTAGESGEELRLSPLPAAAHRFPVELDAVPKAVGSVSVVLALPPGARFGGQPAPYVAIADGGTELASFTITGLGEESALVALELYRRQGAWKVRAVGQGYAGGLPELLRDLGLKQPKPAPAADPAPEPVAPVDYRHPSRRQQAAATPDMPPQPVAGDATGWTMEERLYNQVRGMFEDLARTIAAYRSAADFAEVRLEQELDRALSDPRTRVGPAADAARDQAMARQADLVDQARAVLDRDLAQLAAEAEVVEPALPPAYAGWDSPVWHGYAVPAEPPMAVRVGDLHLPEDPTLRIPMLVRLPLERGLWVDSAQDRPRALEVAMALAARLLAAHPVGAYALQVIDPSGSASTALAPLADSGALREPPATGAAGVTALLARMTERVDLVQMALRAGAPDSLPPDLDRAEQLIIVNDFPYGFDDRAVNQLRYLADEGPSVGVHLLLVADREDAREFGPVLDPLWRALLRLTPLPEDHLSDPWVGHSWTYEPLLPPAGSQVVPLVLRQLATARQAFGS